ncbi:MAG: YkgJ family cysteine cluster protein [Planctomycetota bacterium]|jgi:Fe-S-cluster containining protein
MSKAKEKTCWYIAGLHFECQKCGACCSGPDEGYIWVTRPEIEKIAKLLKIPIGELRRKYLIRVGFRTTIIEQKNTKDCIFLKEIDGYKKCIIYPVRPSQCRSWPFWPENLKSPTAWNKAVKKCPGINRGRLCTFEEIQKIKNDKHWWNDEKQK